MNKITYIDGPRWYRGLHAGIRHVIARQEYLNNINVFPVPDRDTGTNMALTLNAILDHTYAAPKDHIGRLMGIVADAALEGARGNSGAIIAQFFQGLAQSAQHIDKKMQLEEFANAIQQGMVHAYQALVTPKEGTILTIIKAFSEHLQQRISEASLDFISLLHSSLATLNTALNATKLHLKALQKANVVDAGAQGFVDLLQGIADFIENGSIEQINHEAPLAVQKNTSQELSVHIDEQFRYCTECLIKGEHLDSALIQKNLTCFGDSMVIAGSDTKIKIHIHTNDPQAVFAHCRDYGTVVGEKVDDMIRQQQTINHKRSEVAILTDSAADLPEAVVHDLDIHVVPLQISLGTQHFIDKVTISTSEFYELLRTSAHHPTTSQPNIGDFSRQYQYLRSHYSSIVAIHLSAAMSGTFNAATAAAHMAEHPDSAVIDSRALSIAQGLIVKQAATAAKAGLDATAIQQIIDTAILNVRFYALVPDLSFAVRGGRISAQKKKILNRLKLTPILGLQQSGLLHLCHLVFGKRHYAKKLARFVLRKMKKDQAYQILIAHCDCQADAQLLKQHLEKKRPQLAPIQIVQTGATLGTHAGPSTFAVAFLPTMDHAE